MALIKMGYRGYDTTEAFVAAVKALHPDLVIDARYNTWGRPGFKGYELTRAFQAAGVVYQHRKGLGNLNYKNGGPISIASPEAVDQVHEEAKTKTIVLLCACPTDDPACHVATILRGSAGAPRLL